MAFHWGRLSAMIYLNPTSCHCIPTMLVYPFTFLLPSQHASVSSCLLILFSPSYLPGCLCFSCHLIALDISSLFSKEPHSSLSQSAAGQCGVVCPLARMRATDCLPGSLLFNLVSENPQVAGHTFTYKKLMMGH